MVALCQKRLQTSQPKPAIRFLSGIEGLAGMSRESYDLIVTNAVLHHLPDLTGFATEADSLLKSRGVYIAGHEPNARYYRNPALATAAGLFRTQKHTLRRIRSFGRRLRDSTGQEFETVESATAAEALALGYTTRKLPSGLVRKLVDVHVPASGRQYPEWGYPGFDAEGLAGDLFPNYRLVQAKAYNHIKDDGVGTKGLWGWMQRRLARKWPADGADCTFVLQKSMDSELSDPEREEGPDVPV
jgi:hypothetical protein